jgi:hypothetical protein
MKNSQEIISPNIQKILFSISAIVFVAWAFTFIGQTSSIGIDGKRYFSLFDDGMISMRYAWNLAHGHGLVWNSGEYVEGYSNFLWVLWMAVGSFFFSKANAVLFVQVSGIVIVLSVAIMASALYAEKKKSEDAVGIGSWLVFVGCLAYYPLSYWSLMGMEAGLLTFLQVASIWQAFIFSRTHKSSHAYLLAVLLGLAFLVRNEAVLFAGGVACYLLIANRQKFTQKLLKTFLISILVYCAMVCAFLTFRYAYYGHLVPNTYTLKMTGLPLTERILNGLRFTMIFLQESKYLLIVAVLVLFIRFNSKNIFLASVIALVIGYQIYVGGDPWTYWRMFVPAAPILLILVVEAGEIFAKWLTSKIVGVLPGDKTWLFSFARLLIPACLLFVCLFTANKRFFPEMFFQVTPYSADANANNVNIALAIQAVTDETASVGVVMAGVVPYYTGRYAIDFLGKCDSYIASLPPHVYPTPAWYGMTSVPGHNKYDLAYSIQQLQPTFVEILTWEQDDVKEWAREYYDGGIDYQGIRLKLLKNSPALRWDIITNN